MGNQIAALLTGVLYFSTAALSLWMASRWVVPISLRARLLLGGFPLLFTGRALFTGRIYAPIDLAWMSEPLRSLAPQYFVNRIHNATLSDVYCLNIPWKYAVRVAYSRGEWALWNPFAFAGDILAASAQPTPYEPLFLLSLLLPMAFSLTYIAAMTLLLMGLLMYVFLRDLRCSEMASLTGAAIWMFNLFLVFWLEWVITPTTMWLPLVLLGVRRVIRERSVHAAAILLVAFVMMLLNGHPESALHIVTVGMIWAGVEFAVLRGRGFVKATLLATAAGVVALMLTAIYMLPIIEALPQTAEHFYRDQVYSKMVRSVPLPEAIGRLEAQFVPFVVGLPPKAYVENAPFDPSSQNGYAGGVALALAAFGLWRARWRGKWGALAMVLFGIVAGIEIGPFADWLAKLPLFDIALNGRFVVLAPFGLAILAALGLDTIVEKRDAFLFGIVSAVTAALLAVLVWNAWGRMRELGLSVRFLEERSSYLIIPVLLLAILALALAKKRSQIVVAALVLLLMQRTLESHDFYPTLNPDIFYPPVPLFEALPKDEGPYRIVGHGYSLIPNSATMYQLEDVRGYQAMTFLPMKELQPIWSALQPVWYNRVDDLTHPFLSMMNVRFAIAAAGLPPPPGWRKVAEHLDVQLLENEKVLPRAFIPRTVGIAESPARSFGERIKRTEDFGELSWIQANVEIPHEIANGPGSVLIRQEKLRSFHLMTDTQAPSWVVISQAAWKGWRAHIDGVPAVIHRANHAFIGIKVPAGVRHVYLEYWPRSFVIGRAISVLTIVLLIGFAVWSARKRRRYAGATESASQAE
jgi:hypothetical protein